MVMAYPYGYAPIIGSASTSCGHNMGLMARVLKKLADAQHRRPLCSARGLGPVRRGRRAPVRRRGEQQEVAGHTRSRVMSPIAPDVIAQCRPHTHAAPAAHPTLILTPRPCHPHRSHTLQRHAARCLDRLPQRVRKRGASEHAPLLFICSGRGGVHIHSRP